MNIKIQENFSLKKYNTLGIEASAKYFVEVHSVSELRTILSDGLLKKQNKLIIGGGSNILFSKDFDGLVIKLSSDNIEIIKENEDEVIVEASAGVIWHELVLFCIERNLGGIENLPLIPGTVGAAPVQNIGAYGQELKDTFKSLRGIFIDTLEEQIFEKDECNFTYRGSIFKSELKNKFIITNVTFIFSKRPKLNISYGIINEELAKLGKGEISVKDVYGIVSNIRRSKLPDPATLGNAGSFFRNPEVNKDKFQTLKKTHPNIIGYESGNNKFKIPAGWLIEQVGLKGKRIGRTGTHVDQALVIVNYGEATGEEIMEFQNYVKHTISTTFGIELEEEVNIIY